MTEQFKPKVFYTVSMIAERTGWCARQIRREIAEGRLLGHRTRDGGHWRVQGEDASKWWRDLPNSSDPYAYKEGA